MQTLLQNTRISRHPKAYYKNVEETADMLENENGSDDELTIGSEQKQKLITSPQQMAKHVTKVQKRLKPMKERTQQSKKRDELQYQLRQAQFQS